MNRIRLLAIALSFLAPLTLAAAEAHAFCAVLRETGYAKTARKATKHAVDDVVKKTKALRKQYGASLVLDEMAVECLGATAPSTTRGGWPKHAQPAWPFRPIASTAEAHFFAAGTSAVSSRWKR